jgi:hypothetical protein
MNTVDANQISKIRTALSSYGKAFFQWQRIGRARNTGLLIVGDSCFLTPMCLQPLSLLNVEGVLHVDD